ncbi:M23 family metallopeptidase [Planctomycetota bacterium]
MTYVILFEMTGGDVHAAFRTRTRSSRSRSTSRPVREKTPPPPSEEDQQAQQELARKTLRIRGIQEGQTVSIVVVNRTDHHVTFTLKVTPRNLKAMDERTTTEVLAPRESRSVKSLSIVDPDRPWHYRYQLDMMPGKLDARHDDATIYTLPFKPGTKHRVVQAYGGTMTHKGNNHFSIDFAMGQGTALYAARAGVVAAVKSDSRESGSTEAFLDYANYVTIEHADGTLGEYAHLRRDGVLVKVDQRVEQGQLIGYSGNTGYSKGPHLHFAVRKVISATDFRTIPVKFLTENGVVKGLKPRNSYRCVLPAEKD